MNKEKSVWGKFPLDTVQFLVFMVLGIGFICWALINIGGQVGYFTEAFHSSPSSPTTFTLKQKQIIISDILNLDKIIYPANLAEGDNMGRLLIPVLNQKLQIRQGTGLEELKKGVGHFPQSVLPGERNNCILSGYHDTVFTKIDKLKIGDQLIVKTSSNTYTYEINRIRIVDKDDKTVILPTNYAALTLSTCYPSYVVDNAPNSYIITAELVVSKQT